MHNMIWLNVPHQDESAHLVVFEPGQALGGQHKPVLLRSALHDADVIDGQPALTNDLTAETTCVTSQTRLHTETQY